MPLLSSEIATLSNGLGAVTGASQGLSDLSKAPSGADQAAALLGLTGGLLGLVDTASPFVDALSKGLGVNVAALGVVVGSIQLYNATTGYQSAVQSGDPAAIAAARTELLDKGLGLASAISGTVAAIPIPVLQQAGIAAWTVTTGLQQIFNGNAATALDMVGSGVSSAIEALTGGSHATLTQYGVGPSGDVVTIILTDRFGIRQGEFGQIAGTDTRSRVEVPGGAWIELWHANEDQSYYSYFVRNDPVIASSTLPISDAALTNAYNFGKNPASYVGTGVDFAVSMFSTSGATYDNIGSMLASGSQSCQYSDYLDWLTQPVEFYSNLWASGVNVDAEADLKMYYLTQLEPGIGEYKELPQLEAAVQNGLGSPIVIDLNGDGIKTISLEKSSVDFDITGSGNKNHTGWLSGEDAFLVRDKNGNHAIDGVSEMFGGPNRGDGFSQLSTLDENHDGVVNQLDSQFSTLQVWQDLNSDGVTESGELKSLSDIGLSSLKVAYTTQEVLNSWNLIGETSSATVNGLSLQMADVYFRYKKDPSSAERYAGETSPITLARNAMLADAMAGFNPPSAAFTANVRDGANAPDMKLAVQG